MLPKEKDDALAAICKKIDFATSTIHITVYKLKGKRTKSKKYHGIMHMKMAVIDQKIVIFGSVNWTYSAFSNNYELLYIHQNYAIAKKFEKYFKVLKKRAKLYH